MYSHTRVLSSNISSFPFLVVIFMFFIVFFLFIVILFFFPSLIMLCRAIAEQRAIHVLSNYSCRPLDWSADRWVVDPSPGPYHPRSRSDRCPGTRSSCRILYPLVARIPSVNWMWNLGSVCLLYPRIFEKVGGTIKKGVYDGAYMI